MHVFLAFLLFIAVAFPGLANAHVYAQPCPMEHSKEVALMDAPAPVDDSRVRASFVRARFHLAPSDHSLNRTPNVLLRPER